MKVREVSATADWRTTPLTNSDCLYRILSSGRLLNPLLEAPFVTNKIFRFDWLHVADLGVAPLFLGNLFFRLLQIIPGRSHKEKCAALYQEIQAYYEEQQVEDRFDSLLPTMFIHKKKDYVLRGSAAKIRHLVPFAAKITRELLTPADPVHDALIQAAHHLHETYRALSSTMANPCEHMKEHGLKFALQYVALHDHLNPGNPKAFRIKPKLHLFMHVTSDDSLPARHWTYRDEDFGGSVARMARRRGGMLSCGKTALQVLQKFKLRNPMVRIG